MFICEACMLRNGMMPGFHFRSLGTCEVCAACRLCLDVPSWQLPEDLVLASSKEERHGPDSDA